MLNKIKNRKQEGFTIIEVLIVLAIAGLIMLIVFLAVPALQRNARNNEIKSEASRIATTANEFVANANNTFPSGLADAASIKTQANVTRITSLVIGGAAPTGTAARLFAPGTCSGVAAITAPAGSRSMAVDYILDGGAKACIQI